MFAGCPLMSIGHGLALKESAGSPCGFAHQVSIVSWHWVPVDRWNQVPVPVVGSNRCVALDEAFLLPLSHGVCL